MNVYYKIIGIIRKRKQYFSHYSGRLGSMYASRQSARRSRPCLCLVTLLVSVPSPQPGLSVAAEQ